MKSLLLIDGYCEGFESQRVRCYARLTALPRAAFLSEVHVFSTPTEIE